VKGYPDSGWDRRDINLSRPQSISKDVMKFGDIEADPGYIREEFGSGFSITAARWLHGLV